VEILDHSPCIVLRVFLFSLFFLSYNILTVNFGCRLEHSIQEGDAWGENDDDNEYYNDNPRAQPPSPKHSVPSEYSSPPSNLPVSIH